MTLSLEKALSAGDRANLLDDAFALAEAGQLGYEIPLHMTKYLKNEAHYVPWRAAYVNFADISSKTYTLPFFGDLRVHSMQSFHHLEYLLTRQARNMMKTSVCVAELPISIGGARPE